MSEPSPSSETTIGLDDTHCVSFAPGKRVRVIAGGMQGLAATIIERRAGGTLLIRLHHGVFMVVPPYFLEPA